MQISVKLKIDGDNYRIFPVRPRPYQVELDGRWVRCFVSDAVMAALARRQKDTACSFSPIFIFPVMDYYFLGLLAESSFFVAAYLTKIPADLEVGFISALRKVLANLAPDQKKLVAAVALVYKGSLEEDPQKINLKVALALVQEENDLELELELDDLRICFFLVNFEVNGFARVIDYLIKQVTGEERWAAYHQEASALASLLSSF